jgi:aminopeptidase
MYQPPKKILERYADILVNYALGGGQGIKKGDVVHLIAYEIAKPLYRELKTAILKAGGHVIGDYRPDSGDRFPLDRDFFVNAKDHQLDFFPEKYARGLVEQVDHSIFVISEVDKHELEDVDPKKIMRRGLAWKPYMDWRNDKENKGKYTWTLALYGTEAEAKEAGLSLKEYWRQIIKACFLDKKDPISEWKKVYKELEKTRVKLNNKTISKVILTAWSSQIFTSESLEVKNLKMEM